MSPSANRALLLLGLVAALPLLGNADAPIGIPRSLTDISKGIVAAGKAEFGDCEVSGTSDIRAAALAVTAIETFKRSAWEAAAEWLSIRFGTLLPGQRDDLSIGPAQIKVRTARKFVAMPDEAIANRLSSDPCWSLQLAAQILAERMARCRPASLMEECASEAAAAYNGQKKV